MAVIRAQVTLRYTTQIPADVATNTLYFTVGDPINPLALQNIVERIENGYATGLGDLLSCNLLQTAWVKLYDMAEPEPRAPILEEDITIAPATASTAQKIPTEVAFCLSYHGAYESGVSRARRRGRIYLGPLSEKAAGGSSNPTNFPRPTAEMEQAAIDLSAALAENTLFPDVVWVQRSETTGDVSPVVECWFDNTWDTQRRRGVEATSRFNWDPYDPPS